MSDSATPWTAARQASLSITNSRNLLKFMPIESVMPSNYLILYCPFSFHFQSFSRGWHFATHGLQHIRPPCSSPIPGVLLTLMSTESVMPSNHLILCRFSSCLKSFSASGSFPGSQFYASGDQSIWVSASTSIFPMNIQGWFPLGWTGLMSVQSKGLSRVFSNTTFKNISALALSFLHGPTLTHTWLLEKP